MEIEDLRHEYRLGRLRRNELKSNPFDQFRLWFDQALAAKVAEPNAMALATASAEGKPSCRMVLMKRFEDKGLAFYTNYNSRKAKELEVRPYATATFFWKELERQVVIEGKTERTSREDSERYFAIRPRGSQLSVWASSQGQMIRSRQQLGEAYAEAEARYREKEVPLPPFWGGFWLHPVCFEFWQGREDRLHDRFCYLLERGVWRIERLSP